MKCRSVVCLWSGAPPSHRVTATAALNQPATLYTGGSDGSIIWWNLSSSSSESNLEIQPFAMLCGHAAPIADLAICDPVVFSGNKNMTTRSSNDATNYTFDGCGALISACTDGVLCLWSRSSGHCRRRRKLPPWVGCPSIISTLLSNPRFVCVGCSYIEPVRLSDHHTLDTFDGAETVDKDSHNQKPPKCTVVIVDTYTLTISQTVFHGNLSIGPMKFLSVLQLEEDTESLLMADSSARLQLVPISKDSKSDGEGGSDSSKSSFPPEYGLIEGEKAISVITSDKAIAILSKSRCIFWLFSSGDAIGEISIDEDLLSCGSHVTGAMFITSCDARGTLSTKDDCENIPKRFVVWNSIGYSVLYEMSYINGDFIYKRLGEVAADVNNLNANSFFCFIQLRQYLLCVESISFDADEPFQWKPRVTIWSLYPENDDDGGMQCQFTMKGKGSYTSDWFLESFMDDKNLVSTPEGVSHIGSQYTMAADGKNYGSERQRVVSSSMVVSENYFAPYAVIYGFFNGEIEIIKFDLVHGNDSPAASPHLETDSLVSRQQFLGHTGAVLCLAAHRMFAVVNGWSFTHVLISGSMDCTVRIWDLDSGNIIMTMHHHVAPVRQILLPPARTERPWSDCFISVGEDSCVALSSLETLRVERMFPGHPNYPTKVVWDGSRGYIACLCKYHSKVSEAVDVLYIWDVKTGARERVLRGTASHSMFDHFCKGVSMNTLSGAVLNANTSVSSLLFSVEEEKSPFYLKNNERAGSTLSASKSSFSQANSHRGDLEVVPATPSVLQLKRYPPIKCTCPFPGVSALIFDLSSLSIYRQIHEDSDKLAMKDARTDTQSPQQRSTTNRSPVQMTEPDSSEALLVTKEMEEYLIRVSLSFLHLWGIDQELDQLLITQMKLRRPGNFIVASGLQGDKGSLTLTFPGKTPVLELWKSSSEFCAMRSLMMVSLALCMISLSHSTSAASSALEAFYTRSFADKYPDLKPPLLQLLVTFWQNGNEHVSVAARSLFHSAASRAIPPSLCRNRLSQHGKLTRLLSRSGEDQPEVSRIGATDSLNSENSLEAQRVSQTEETELLAWLESFEMQDWITCVGGTNQDAMASHIIVAAALSIWYTSLVKSSLPRLVVHPLIKLVMAMNEKYSSTAAELLAEGMETTWKHWIGSDIHRLISDIFFQIECVSGGSSGESTGANQAVRRSIKDTLVGVLLPSLAMVDFLGFLGVIESQIWSTASDSPVHLVSLKTLIIIVRDFPRNVVQHLEKMVHFILQTIDPGNSVMRKTCLHTSMAALKEVVRVFPMVAVNETATRLAVGDAVAEINHASIRIYDMQSVSKLKVLDASGPPGVPSLLGGASENAVTTAISTLSFSPDGEGLVAFSENGLTIRWWSLGSVWWEKLSRSFVPVQCTKLIFVPPWEGFSPNLFRSSVISSILGHERDDKKQETAKNLNHADHIKQLVHNLDLSYRLEWVGERKVKLTSHGVDLGTFPL